MTKLYETSPLAIEIKALVNNSQGEPIFAWVTITTDSIECVSEAQTTTGGGATVRLKSGAMLLVSNSYKDISAAIIGDAKQFTSDDSVEVEILAGQPQAEEGPSVDAIADAVSGCGGCPSSLESVDGVDFDEDFDEDYDTGSL